MKEPVTSALNTRNWLSGRINKGMTPKQCHVAHCNSQQVEGNTRWDRHSSGDLRNRQMEGQDERSRRIYITREISRRGGRAIRKTPGSSIGGVSEEEKKNSSSDEARGRTLTLFSTTLLTILFPMILSDR